MGMVIGSPTKCWMPSWNMSGLATCVNSNPKWKRVPLQPIRYTKGDHPVDPALLGIGRTTLYRKLEEYGL